MIKPLTNRILVRPIPKPQGRIILPPSHQPSEDDPIEAEVVLLGTQKIDRQRRPQPWTVKPGDRVLVVDYMGAPVQAFGQRHLVVKEESILAIVIEPEHEYCAGGTRPRMTPNGAKWEYIRGCECSPGERRGPLGGVCWCGGAIPESRRK